MLKLIELSLWPWYLSTLAVHRVVVELMDTVEYVRKG